MLSLLIALGLAPIPGRSCIEDLNQQLQGVYAALLIAAVPLVLLAFRGVRRALFTLLTLLFAFLGAEELWFEEDDYRVPRSRSLPAAFQVIQLTTALAGESSKILPLREDEVQVSFRSIGSISPTSSDLPCYLRIQDGMGREIVVRSQTFGCTLKAQSSYENTAQLGALVELLSDSGTLPLILYWALPGCSDYESEANYLSLRRPSTAVREESRALFVGAFYGTLWSDDLKWAKGMADLSPLLPISSLPWRAFLFPRAEEPIIHVLGRGFERAALRAEGVDSFGRWMTHQIR